MLSFPFLTQVISTWGVQNNIDFLSLSFTRHAEDVRHVRVIADRFHPINYVFLAFPHILFTTKTSLLHENICKA